MSAQGQRLPKFLPGKAVPCRHTSGQYLRKIGFRFMDVRTCLGFQTESEGANLGAGQPQAVIR